MTEIIQQTKDEEIALMYEAASRFLAEVTHIKLDFYRQRFNTVLLLETKMAIKGLLTRYKSYGFFTDETVEVTLRHAKRGMMNGQLDIRYSPGLYSIIQDVKAQLAAEEEKASAEQQ